MTSCGTIAVSVGAVGGGAAAAALELELLAALPLGPHLSAAALTSAAFTFAVNPGIHPWLVQPTWGRKVGYVYVSPAHLHTRT
jgi:hypothetical protein